MNGYSSHTLKLVNEEGEASFVKWHFKTDQGSENFTAEEAARLAGTDPDYATRDLFKSIGEGKFPSWSVFVQRMTPAEAATYRFNPWDVTKVWPHADYPLIPVGRMVLNRNPKNYFAEVEQAAFSPGNLVPGIEPTPDKMLQGRLFSYPDTHRHRLGPNFAQIPINQPLMTVKVRNYQRDGFMTVNGNQGDAPNYEPNSVEGAPQATSQNTSFTPYSLDVKPRIASALPLHLEANRFHPSGGPAATTERVADVDFVQAGALYRLQSPEAKARLISNIAGHLKNAKLHIQERQLGHFKKADPEYGNRVHAELVRQTRLRL